MIKVTGRWERGEPGISCPVTLVFHLILNSRKSLNCLADTLFVPSKGLTSQNMRCGLTLGCSLGRGHSIFYSTLS